MFKLRTAQQKVYNFSGGKMGVSAVPGSGKTYTLSCLAAKLIGEGSLKDDQEVLIVTLVNSAVRNFEQKLARSLKEEYNLLPKMGYRVRTLHGLANDIVRIRPELAGLSDEYQILDEREASDILKNSAETWLRSHPEFIEDWGDPERPLQGNGKYSGGWSDLVVSIASNFIRSAKDFQATPAAVRQRLDRLQINLPLLEMGYEIYTSYQHSLAYRSAIDFDDLIRLALQSIQADPSLLEWLQYRWPYILEDEAQDSSRLQEQILRLLVGERGNWVRVGDPNQAIFETFTTADPKFLKDFIHEPGVESVALPNSGRSTQSIIQLANRLIELTLKDPPYENFRDVLSTPLIQKTDSGDLQPNPPDHPDSVRLITKKYEADKEIQDIARSVKHWLIENKDKTVAVLVPRNTRGSKVAEALRASGVEVVELLQTSLDTREIARQIGEALRYLDDPTSKTKLTALFKNIYRQEETQGLNEPCLTLLKNCIRVEELLKPTPEKNWLESLADPLAAPDVVEKLEQFRHIINRWQAAVFLPVDQLILTLVQDLFHEPDKLATAHKLALLMEHDAQVHPIWRLPNFAVEMENIAHGKRKAQGLGEDEVGFDPDSHAGKVVVATIHKAKGLEWNRVYLASVNNYDFPAGQPYEKYISERWFVRGQLNLEEETLSKLKALMEEDLPGLYLPAGTATEEARYAYAAERLRLLFVGITRAKNELIITWNTGQRGDSQPAAFFTALQTFWEEKNVDHSA
jgi:DNA helicase II / ATP-dependent DNA helicase PcrA